MGDFRGTLDGSLAGVIRWVVVLGGRWVVVIRWTPVAGGRELKRGAMSYADGAELGRGTTRKMGGGFRKRFHAPVGSQTVSGGHFFFVVPAFTLGRPPF